MFVTIAFGVFGVLLAIGFFINGVVMNPPSAIQQQVQYLSWVISAAGWIIAALAMVMGQLHEIAAALRSKEKTETPKSKLGDARAEPSVSGYR